NPCPAAANIALEVVHGVGVGRRAMWIPKKRSVTTRVVVVNAANIEPEIAEGFLPATVEVHFDVAARVTRTLTYVRVPVAEVDAARVAVIEAALDRRLAEGLVDATEPVLRYQSHVSSHWRRRRCGGLLVAGNARRGCRSGERQWKDELAHLMLSLKVDRKCRSTVSISYAIAFLAALSRASGSAKAVPLRTGAGARTIARRWCADGC